jgi:hypothetical protein
MTEEDKGMLRDIFAGLSMCGLVMRNIGTPQDMAEASYRMADALMEAREPKETIGLPAIKKRIKK